MNLLPTNSLGGRFDCRYFAISCRLSAGSPPCVCYCATTYILNWRHACFQTRTTRSSNHRHSSCINDLEAALTAGFLPFPAGFSALPPPKKVAWRRQQIDDFAHNLTPDRQSAYHSHSARLMDIHDIHHCSGCHIFNLFAGVRYDR